MFKTKLEGRRKLRR